MARLIPCSFLRHLPLPYSLHLPQHRRQFHDTCVLDMFALTCLPCPPPALLYQEALMSAAVLPMLSWLHTGLWRGFWGGVSPGFSLLPSLPAASWTQLLAGRPTVVPASTSPGTLPLSFFPSIKGEGGLLLLLIFGLPSSVPHLVSQLFHHSRK